MHRHASYRARTRASWPQIGVRWQSSSSPSRAARQETSYSRSRRGRVHVNRHRRHSRRRRRARRGRAHRIGAPARDRSADALVLPARPHPCRRARLRRRRREDRIAPACHARGPRSTRAVFNKADAAPHAAQAISGAGDAVSAKTGEGLDALRRKLLETRRLAREPRWLFIARTRMSSAAAHARTPRASTSASRQAATRARPPRRRIAPRASGSG